MRLVESRLGRALQAMVKGENFILRAVRCSGWDPSGFCVQKRAGGGIWGTGQAGVRQD